MSIKTELTKKIFGVPLFIILFGCILVGGVIAESVNFTFDMSGVTHTQDPPPTGEESGSTTFTIEEKLEYLDIHTVVTGNAVYGSDGVFSVSSVTNNHPTETYTIELRLQYQMTGDAGPFTDRASASKVVAPGATVDFSDYTWVSFPSSGECTLTVSFYSISIS